jgi:hypothetical protein
MRQQPAIFAGVCLSASQFVRKPTGDTASETDFINASAKRAYSSCFH